MTEEKIIDEQNIEDFSDDNEQNTAEALNEEPTLEQQLEEARAAAADFEDRWKRSQADFANAKKRMDKQRTQIYQMSTADLAKKLLPVIDDFERAVENVPEQVVENSWFEGIELVHKKLSTILEQFDVVPIEAAGEPFDPNIHDAVTAESSEEFESGIVIKELQKGYKVGEQVIRPSLVIVAQ